MGRRAHAQRLHVWMNGIPVGYWDAAAGGNTLTYFEDWLENIERADCQERLSFSVAKPATLRRLA